jgi:dihydroflavonol-4-reductase
MAVGTRSVTAAGTEKRTGALVLGATGHIGSAIARELLSRGYRVTAASRRAEPPLNLQGLAVARVCGDADAPGQLEAWAEGHGVVVDAAAPYPLRLRRLFDRAEPDPIAYARERTRRLLAVVRTHSARLIYVSSFTTMVRPRAGFGGWQAALARRLHPYFRVKEAIESELIRAARAGIPVVIVNPTVCLGPGDLKERERCFVPRLLCGEIRLMPRIVLNVIDVREVAAAALDALEAERYGAPALLAGHDIAVDALFDWICELGGCAPPRYEVPPAAGVLPAWLAELMLSAAGAEPPMLSLVPALLAQHDWLNPQAPRSQLGFRPRPLSQTLRDTIDWYRRLGYC